MRELLTETGSIFVHLDWHGAHDVKVLMNEIFGAENFVRNKNGKATLFSHKTRVAFFSPNQKDSDTFSDSNILS